MILSFKSLFLSIKWYRYAFVITLYPTRKKQRKQQEQN